MKRPTASEPARGGDSSFWCDRPTLVTGAAGLVGVWTVRRLLSLEAEVVCLVRDWVPQSELVFGGLLDDVRVVRGDIRQQYLAASRARKTLGWSLMFTLDEGWPKPSTGIGVS